MVARSREPRNAPRGPAAMKRRSGARSDREGDLTMDFAVKGRGGRVGKATTPTPAARDLISRVSRSSSTRTSALSGTARGAILRQAGASDVSMKEARVGHSRGGLVELKVTGWEKSKAASNPDGGVSTLVTWLGKKASNRLGSRARQVKVKKSRVDGTTMVISVLPEDVAAIVRMNGYEWAGANITIERLGAAAKEEAGLNTADTKALLRGVLERRYNQDAKFLDLSALGQDADLQKQNVFDKKSTISKLFPAMMRVLELCFDSEAERHTAITSVSLANNDLTEVNIVSTLSLTLNKLQNLDLSNNQLASLSALQIWKKRFFHLQHLILSGNPIEQNQPEYPAEIVKWYPNLRMLNNVQVRTEEEIASKETTELPFPIRSPLFQDEGGIAETFIWNFFVGFDTGRAALAALYYDEQSDFSFAVNTQAPRDASEQTEKQEWDHYIKNSRNLKKITQLPARLNRHFRGPKAVADAFASLPASKHPDLAAEARKWMIEAHIQPGVPDATGGNAGGVDGFMITVHGEYEELDTKKRRSFDRTFIIGPGGSSGIRVVNDMLTIRAYGGAQAFEPDHFDGGIADAQQHAANLDAVPQLPAGLTVQMAEQMVLEMQQQTGMTVQYAKDCLEQVGWDFQKGLEAFASVKDNLTAEAFVQQG